ncbi:MAG TPA: cytochrome d ubiquinol oxidase subunit II [Candidatus Nanopelagicales bacterium]
MELTTVWFILIAVLWIGYFVLEGFDFGVGMLLPVVGKGEAERRAMITTLGPVWDGNEVWVLVAGGATFAAFPEWYATLFSGFYLPLFLILVALIVRGVAFEYRSKRSDGSWRARWDAAIVFGSFLPALLWGVAFSNIVRGVPLAEIEGNIEYDGGFFNLLNPFALLGGLVFVAIFLTHGAVFLSLKTTGDIRERAHAVGMTTGLVATVLAVVYLLWAQLAYSDKTWTWVPVLLAAVAWLGAVAMHRVRKEGPAFIFSAVTIGLAVVALFGMLYPNVMPNLDPAGPSLTIDNASSTDYTLTIMTWVAVIFTPIVLAYQSWSYWVFRKRVGAEHIANAEVGSLDEVHV